MWFFLHLQDQVLKHRLLTSIIVYSCVIVVVLFGSVNSYSCPMCVFDNYSSTFNLPNMKKEKKKEIKENPNFKKKNSLSDINIVLYS